jgi:hypothetical protein
VAEETAAQQPAPQPMSIEDRIQTARMPAPDVIDQPDEPEAASAEPVEEVTAEATPEPDAPEEAPAEEASSDGDVPTISSIDDIAEYLGVDVAELYGVEVPVEVNGERRDISLGEWKDAYREAETLKAEREALQAERVSIEAIKTEKTQELEAQIAQAAGLAQMEMNRLKAASEQINWDELREADPTEWVAKRQEIQERAAEIQRVGQQISEQYKQHQAQIEQEAATKHQEQLTRERDALLSALPAWQDQSVFERESAQMRDYLAANGFTPEEVGSISDHRMILIAEKARAFDEQSKQVETTRKRVVKVGKRLARPGSASTKAQAAADQSSALHQQLRKSGRVEDAAALIAAARRS